MDRLRFYASENLRSNLENRIIPKPYHSDVYCFEPGGGDTLMGSSAMGSVAVAPAEWVRYLRPTASPPREAGEPIVSQRERRTEPHDDYGGRDEIQENVDRMASRVPPSLVC